MHVLLLQLYRHVQSQYVILVHLPFLSISRWLKVGHAHPLHSQLNLSYLFWCRKHAKSFMCWKTKIYKPYMLFADNCCKAEDAAAPLPSSLVLEVNRVWDSPPPAGWRTRLTRVGSSPVPGWPSGCINSWRNSLKSTRKNLNYRTRSRNKHRLHEHLSVGNNTLNNTSERKPANKNKWRQEENDKPTEISKIEWNDFSQSQRLPTRK